MKPSVEVRWFFHQHLPEEVKDWFCGSKLCKEEARRTDHYLIFPGSSSVGVKVRDGRKFQVKARVTAPEPFSLPGGTIVGRLDSWVKWSYGDTEMSKRLADLRLGDPLWVSVIKERWLRKFQLDDRQLTEVDAENHYDRGCTIELTRVTVKDSHWWTLAFESFGPTPLADDLARTAAHFLKLLPHGLALTERDSMAYPEWLDRNAG
jgi:hypothetical protein